MKKRRAIISKLTAASLLFSLLGQYAIPVLAQEPPDEAEKQYIIVAENTETYQEIAEEVSEDITAQADVLDDNNVIVAELASDTADALSENSGLIVEEDITISASLMEDELPEPSAEALAAKEEITQKKKEIYARLREAKADAAEDSGYEWNMQAIHADELSPGQAAEQQKVKVAVLDSGVDYVTGLNLAGYVNLIEEEEELSPIFQDSTGHGTAIAGIIAGNGENGVRGVAPDVELYSVKALGDQNSAPLSRIIQGIYWCIEHDMDIINMSFGTPVCSRALEKAVEDAYAANILMVAASGNTGGTVEYPAAFPQVLAVAATAPTAELSDFSNTGEELDVAAPGEKIRTTGFFNGNVVTGGTSIAVPHVTGTAALLWERDLSKSNEFIRQLIRYSAIDLPDTDDCGLLDAAFALENYDCFAQNYHPESLPDESVLPENTQTPESFEYVETDDAYVEGRWKGPQHEEVIDKSGSTLGFSADAIAVIKKGATYPDHSDLKFCSENPRWHGGTVSEFGTEFKDNNYAAAAEIVSIIALYNGDVSSVSPGDVMGATDKLYTMLTNDIKAMDFNSILTNNTKTNRKYFLYGCAIHGLTDIFAHSATTADGVFIGHRFIYSNKADDINSYPRRYIVASKLAEISMAMLLSNTYLDGSDIANALDEAYGKGTYKIIKLKKYINNNGVDDPILDKVNIPFASITLIKKDNSNL